MGDVAKAFSVTLPAVTHIVDRLEEKQFVQRSADVADRRAYVLELTRRGAEIARDLKAARMEGLERVVGRMTPSQRGQAVEGLEALVEAALAGPRRSPR